MSTAISPPLASPFGAPLILASTSTYRAALLDRLRLPFERQAPEVDEQARPGEEAEALAMRLAEAKARAVATIYPAAVVIGSDQVAACGERLLGKPGSHERALEQLGWLSGRCTLFHTAVAVVANGQCHRGLDTTRAWMRALDADALARYVSAEPALDCAGSFKVEGYGITLFERIESNDPTGLEGLPLILTARLLRAAGYRLP